MESASSLHLLKRIRLLVFGQGIISILMIHHIRSFIGCVAEDYRESESVTQCHKENKIGLNNVTLDFWNQTFIIATAFVSLVALLLDNIMKDFVQIHYYTTTAVYGLPWILFSTNVIVPLRLSISRNFDTTLDMIFNPVKGAAVLILYLTGLPFSLYCESTARRYGCHCQEYLILIFPISIFASTCFLLKCLTTSNEPQILTKETKETDELGKQHLSVDCKGKVNKDLQVDLKLDQQRIYHDENNKMASEIIEADKLMNLGASLRYSHVIPVQSSKIAPKEIISSCNSVGNVISVNVSDLSNNIRKETEVIEQSTQTTILDDLESRRVPNESAVCVKQSEAVQTGNDLIKTLVISHKLLQVDSTQFMQIGKKHVGSQTNLSTKHSETQTREKGYKQSEKSTQTYRVENVITRNKQNQNGTGPAQSLHSKRKKTFELIVEEQNSLFPILASDDSILEISLTKKKTKIKNVECQDKNIQTEDCYIRYREPHDFNGACNHLGHINKTIHSVSLMSQNVAATTEPIRFKASKSQHGIWYVSLRGDIFLTVSQEILKLVKFNKNAQFLDGSPLTVEEDIVKTMKLFVDNYNKLSDCFDDENENEDESYINGFRL